MAVKKTKQSRIAARKKELLAIYQELTPEKMKLALPLIENASFLEIELEDLQKVISEKGTIEDYKNGNNQYGKKVGSEVQSYNSLMKTYGVINKRLAELLPSSKKPVSGLEAFLNEEE